MSDDEDDDPRSVSSSDEIQLSFGCSKTIKHTYFDDDDDEDDKHKNGNNQIGNENQTNDDQADSLNPSEKTELKSEKTKVVERPAPTTIRIDGSDLITRCKDFIPLLSDPNPTTKVNDEQENIEDIDLSLIDDDSSDENKSKESGEASSTSTDSDQDKSKPIPEKKRKKKKKKKKKKKVKIIDNNQDTSHEKPIVND